jgi:hypothetical protein
MATFWLLDLDVCEPSEFEEQAVEVDGLTEYDAAEAWAVFDEMVDGMSMHVLVADNPQGENAIRMRLVQHIEVRVEARDD